MLALSPRARRVPASRTTRSARRGPAAVVAVVLALAGTVLAIEPATAAGASIVIDDFSGTMIGTRSTAGDGSIGFSGGGAQVSIGTGNGIQYAELLWTFSSPVDLTQGGVMTQLQMDYSGAGGDPLAGNPILVGVYVDTATGQRSLGGNGLFAGSGKFVANLIKLTPPGETDYRLLTGTGDLTRATSVKLQFISYSSTAPAYITVDQLAAVGTESAYTAPTFSGPTAISAQPGQTVNATLAVSGYPAPTLTTSGSYPPGVTMTRVGTSIVFGGAPTATGTWTYTVNAATLHWLTGSQSVTFTVFTPPTLTGSTTFTTRAGQAFSQALTVGGDPLPTTATFSPALPAGLTGTVSGTTLTIAGTPTAAPGAYASTVTVSNGYDTATAALAITVQGPATLPALSDTLVAVDTAITPIQITGGGYPAPTVTVTGLPAGLTGTPTAGGTRITGAPTATGTSTVTVTGDNAVGAPATRTFSLVVGTTPTLDAPVLTPAPVGVAVRVPITVTGYPAPVVTAESLPAGLGVSEDAAGWSINGTPTGPDLGPVTVTIRATNGLGTGATTATTLAVLGAPTLSGPSTADLSLGAAAAPITFSGTGYPMPTLRLADGQTLPPGLELSTGAGGLTISGTPTRTGVWDLTVVAENSEGTAEQTVRVTVGMAPVFADDAVTLTVREGQSVTHAFEAASYPSATFAVVAGTLPSGLTLAADGTLSGTPAAGSADAGSGSYAVTVTATNGFGSDTLAVTLVVLSAPTFPAGLPTATFAAGTASSYGFTTGGWDRPSVTLLDPLPTGLSLTDAGDADPTTWSITGTVARELMGPHTVRIALDNAFGVRTTRTLTVAVTAPFVWDPVVTDVIVETGVPIASIVLTGTGYPIPTSYYLRPYPTWLSTSIARHPGGAASTSITFTLTGTPTTARLDPATVYPAFGVAPRATVTFHVTDRPVLTAPATQTVLSDTAVDIPVTVTGSPAAAITATGLPTGLAVVAGALPGEWHITGTVARDTFGTYDVTLTADNGLTATRDLTLTVEGVPALDDATVSTYLGTAADGVVRATGSPVPTLAVTAGDLPPGLTATADSSGGIAFTGTPTTPGRWDVTVTATNAHGTDSATVSVEVRSAPVFTDASIEYTLREGDPVDFTADATGYPAHIVEVASGTLPAGLTLSPSGRVTGTPALGSADAGSGRYELVLRAWNAEGEDTVPVTLVVLSAPSFPAGLPTMSIDADTVSSYTFTTGGWDRPTVTLLDPLPEGLALSQVDKTTWQITGTVARALRGPHTVRVALDNAFGVRTEATLQIEVNAPIVWGDAPSTVLVETGVPMAPLTLTATAYRVPQGASLSGPPSWLNWQVTTWSPTEFAMKFYGTPTVAGPVTFTVRLGGGPAITVLLLVTDRPVITAPAALTTAAGDPVSIDIAVAGSPASALTATGLPAGLTLVPGATAGTWQITGTPGRGELGEHTITLTADNGLTTTQDLALTIIGGALLESPTTEITTRLDEPMAPVSWTASGYPAPDVELVGDLPPGVVATTGPDGVSLTGTPTTPGTWEVTVRASNAYGTDERTVTITVADLPSFADESLDLVMIEGVPTSVSLPLRGFPFPTVDVVGAIPGMTVEHVPGSDPVLTGTPEAGSAGEHTLTITARNTISGTEQTDVLTVNVRVDAQPQFLAGTDALVATVGTPVSRTIQVSGAPEATVLATGLPTGLGLVRTDAGTWSLSGTPAAGSGGQYTIHLTADNGVLDPVTADVDVTVREPVTAVHLGSTALRVGSAGSISVSTSGGWPTPPTLRVEGALPRGLSFVDNGDGTGQVVGTPAAGTAGTWTVTVVADNGVGATQATLTFTVAAAPRTASGGDAATGSADGDDAATPAGDGSTDGSTDAGDAGETGDGDTEAGSGSDDGDGATQADDVPDPDVPITVTTTNHGPWWWALWSLLLGLVAAGATYVARRIRQM